MATFNLVRNSRLVFTTNVNANGKIGKDADGTTNTPFTVLNSQEIQVLDGFSFNQDSNADTIKIEEAGPTPTRGQRSFNTSLGTVDFSFTTYLRPGTQAGTYVTAEEQGLWNALFSSSAAVDATVTTVTTATVTSGAITLVGTGFPTTIKVGDIYTLKGITGLGANEYNSAVKVLTIPNSGLGFTGVYLTTPVASAPAVGSWAALKLSTSAWNANLANASEATGSVYKSAYSVATSVQSNKNQLMPFGLVIQVDNVTYLIDNCALDQAVIDFGLTGIATVAWTGKGTVLRQLATNATFGLPSATGTQVSGDLNFTGLIGNKDTKANFITNKLSTISLKTGIGGSATSAIDYTLALTGGSITINNGLTYVTPEILGVVNQPIGYFTGSRDISGSLTAYLRTGTTGTAKLLSELIANAATTAGVEPKYKMQIEIGGATSATRVEIQMDGAFLQIPTVTTGSVMSTTIMFKAQATEATQSNTSGYDIEGTNDIKVRYFSGATAATY